MVARNINSWITGVVVGTHESLKWKLYRWRRQKDSIVQYMNIALANLLLHYQCWNMLRITLGRLLKVIYFLVKTEIFLTEYGQDSILNNTHGVHYKLVTVKLTTLKTIRAYFVKPQSRFSTFCQFPWIRYIVVLCLKCFFGTFLLKCSQLLSLGY